MRPNPALKIKDAILQLAVGEALMSFLDVGGSPTVTERLWVIPPASRIGPISPDERQALMSTSLVAGVYDETVDRESAHEILRTDKSDDSTPAPPTKPPTKTPAKRTRAAKKDATDAPAGSGLANLLFGSTGPRGGRREGLLDTVARELTRGVLGSLVGRRSRR